jgi:uncharacterized protein (DUF1800 family)
MRRPYAARAFCVPAVALIALAAASQPQPPRQLNAHEQAVHVLNRLAFGPRPGDIDRVKAIGVDRWIDQQLHPERIDDAALDRFIASSYRAITGDQTELLRQYNEAQRARQMARRTQADTARGDARELSPEDSMARRQRQMLLRNIGGELQSQKVARAVATQRQLLEVMTDFWMNHFNVFIRKGGPQPFFIPAYEAGIRAHALGNFRELVGFVAKSPAMLFYLDNARSVADSGQPTLAAQRRSGLGARRGAGAGAGARRQEMSAEQIAQIIRRRFPDAQIDSARIEQIRRQAQLGGRRRGLNENYARELLELHTMGVDGGYTQRDVIEVARALTGWTIRPAAQGGGFIFRPAVHDAGEKIVLGHRLSAGRGVEDGEDVLDIVARHPATATYIAGKLARRFVSDTPSKALVDYAAGVFTRTNGDIRATMRAIVTSPEFFSRRAYRAKVKSPFEVVVSAARALGGSPDATPRTALAVAFLGQPLYGHQAPNGYPETGDAWMNTGAILNRINFGLAVGAERIPGVSSRTWPDRSRLERAARGEQVASVVASVIGAPVSQQTQRILTSGEHPMIASGAVARAVEESNRRQVNDQNEESMGSDESEMSPQPRPAQPRPAQQRPGAGQRNQLFARMGSIPDLEGLAEVVGLAIGSPEFQRR